MASNSKRVLITGAPERVDALGKRFAAADVEQVTLPQPGSGARAVDYYVQLGDVVPARGDTLVRRVHSFLSDGLLGRFAIAERVLPLLADDAVVLLVAGNLQKEIAAPDDRLARLSLLRVLAHAMRADLAPKRVRIRVISSDRSDDEITEYALTGARDPLAEVPPRPDYQASSRTYEDWRIQMMGLAHIET
jgi:hypothetical protein